MPDLEDGESIEVQGSGSARYVLRNVGEVYSCTCPAWRLGALLVELADGTRFSVGTGFSDRERRDPPPVGAVVTFRYQELSEAGVPRFPSYVGVRDDVRWPPDNALVRRAIVSPPTDTI